MTTATVARPTPHRLAPAEADLRQAEVDLAMLEDARRDRRAEFEDARRAGADMEELGRINTALSTIEHLLTDQRGDVAKARAQVDKLRADAVRADQLAAVHAAHAELQALHTEFGDALASAVAAVTAAFEPVRRVRARWIEARERAGEQIERAGVPRNPSSGTQRDTLMSALEALGVSRHVFLSAPDAKAVPIFPGFGGAGHFPLPSALEAQARAAGVLRNDQPPELTADAFLRLAVHAVQAALQDPVAPR